MDQGYLFLIYLAIVTGIVLIIWFFVYLKKRQDEVESNFQKRFAGKNIRMLDKAALFVAQESDGYSHSRGIASLVLTDEELYFERRIIKKIR